MTPAAGGEASSERVADLASSPSGLQPQRPRARKSPRISPDTLLVALTVLATWTSLTVPDGVLSRATPFEPLLLCMLLPLLRTDSSRAFYLQPIRRNFAIALMAALVAGVWMLAVEPAPLEALAEHAGLVVGMLTLGVVSSLRLTSRTAVYRAWALTAVVAVAATFVQIGTIPRLTGPFRFPNELAFFACALASVAIYLNYRRLVPSLWYFVMIGSSGALALLSGSRTGFVAYLALLSAYWVLLVITRSSTLRFTVLAGVVLTAGWLLGIQGLTEEINDQLVGAVSIERLEALPDDLQASANDFHLDNWRAGWQVFADSPAIGKGWSGSMVDSAVLPGSFEIHNTFLGLLAAGGLVGAALVALGIGALIRNTGRIDRPLLAILVVGNLPLLLYHNLWGARTAWLAVGCIVLLSKRRTHARSRPDT